MSTAAEKKGTEQEPIVPDDAITTEVTAETLLEQETTDQTTEKPLNVASHNRELNSLKFEELKSLILERFPKTTTAPVTPSPAVAPPLKIEPNQDYNHNLSKQAAIAAVIGIRGNQVRMNSFVSQLAPFPRSKAKTLASAYNYWNNPNCYAAIERNASH